MVALVVHTENPELMAVYMLSNQGYYFKVSELLYLVVVPKLCTILIVVPNIHSRVNKVNILA
jgi:hypothetical protein